MDDSGSQKLAIAFVIDYAKNTPVQVCAILTRSDGRWRAGDVLAAKHSPRAAANQMAALFSLFKLMRRGKISEHQVPGEEYPTVCNMGDKVLRFQGPPSLLALPCFLPKDVPDEDGINYVEERRRERKTSFSPAHPFFSKWYIGSGDIILNHDYRRVNDGEIIFIKGNGFNLRDLEERLSRSDIDKLRVSSDAGLKMIARRFSKKTRPLSGVAATPSHKSRSRKHPKEPNDAWEQGYLRRLSEQITPSAIPWYVDAPVFPHEKQCSNAESTRPEIPLSTRNNDPIPSTTALQTLHSGTRVVLLGDPGTGKTTALTQYSIGLMEERSKGRQNPHLPAVIDLTQKSESPETLFKSAIRAPFDEHLPDFTESGITFTVLFDGIDRLSRSVVRSQFVQDAFALIGHSGIGQVILTCKSSDWTDTYGRGQDVTVYEMGTFSDEDGCEIEEYVQTRFGEDGDEALRCIRRDARVRSMARNPQLLALACDVIQLDGASVNLSRQKSGMLAAWIQTKLRIQDHPDAFWYPQCEPLLTDIAFHMMEAGVFELQRADILRAGINVERIAEYDPLELAKDAGILSSAGSPARDPGIRFVHQTFQEYYASLRVHSELASSSDPVGYVEQLAAYCRWDETVALAIERITERESLQVILLHLTDKTTQLAADVIARCAPLDTESIEAIISLVMSLPPSSALTYSRFKCLTGLDSAQAHDALHSFVEQHPDLLYLYWEALDPMASFHKDAFLEGFLGHQNKDLAEWAAYQLVRYSPEQHIDIVLKECRSESLLTRNGAIMGLGKLRTPDAVSALIEIVRSAPRPSLLESPAIPAIKALAQMQSQDADAAIEKILKSSALADHDRFNMAAAICTLDRDLEEDARLMGITNHFIWASPESQKDIMRDYRQISRSRGIGRRSMKISKRLRRVVLAILAPKDGGPYYFKGRSDEPSIPGDLWFFLARAQSGGEDGRSKNWDYLCELLEDESKVEQRHDIVTTMAWVAPDRTLEYFAPGIRRKDDLSIEALYHLGNVCDSLPEGLTHAVFEAFADAEDDRGYHFADAIKKLVETSTKRDCLIKFIPITPLPKLEYLIAPGVVWDEDGLVTCLRDQMAASDNRSVRQKLARALAVLGKDDGLRCLIESLPPHLKGFPFDLLLAGRGTDAFRELVCSIERFANMPGDRKDSDAGALLAQMIASVDLPRRNQAITYVSECCNTTIREWTYTKLSQLSGERYKELLPPAKGAERKQKSTNRRTK